MSIPDPIQQSLKPGEHAESWGTTHGKRQGDERHRSLPHGREFVRFAAYVTSGTYNVIDKQLLRNGDKAVIQMSAEEHARYAANAGLDLKVGPLQAKVATFCNCKKDQDAKTNVAVEYTGQAQFVVYTVDGGKDKKKGIPATELTIYCIYRETVAAAAVAAP